MIRTKNEKKTYNHKEKQGEDQSIDKTILSVRR